MGSSLLGIEIGEGDFCHRRVRPTEYVGMSERVLLESKMDQSHSWCLLVYRNKHLTPANQCPHRRNVISFEIRESSSTVRA